LLHLGLILVLRFGFVDSFLVSQDLAVRRNRAAERLKGCFLSWISSRRRRTWRTNDVNQLESRFTLQNRLDAFRILHAGDLQKDLVRTLRAVRLQRRLGNTERVYTAVDNVQRLRRSVFCEDALGG